jgi:hypothetical protein
MVWGDVRYCFAMAILVLITLLSGDVLLFYVSFSLYYYSYYYYSSTHFCLLDFSEMP